MGKITLRRYTNLAAACRILKNRQLVLRGTEHWEDQNDAYTMTEYKRVKMAKSLLALCFTEGIETYHHWKIYSPGEDGVCLNFRGDALLAHLRNAGLLMHRVRYKELDALESMDAHLDELPFLKRYPYLHEREYRMIYVDYHREIREKVFAIALEHIEEIKFSPWMPKMRVNVEKQKLRSIRGSEQIKIYQSTVTENPRWKKFVDRVARRCSETSMSDSDLCPTP
jgi:hypothetical protein